MARAFPGGLAPCTGLGGPLPQPMTGTSPPELARQAGMPWRGPLRVLVPLGIAPGPRHRIRMVHKSRAERFAGPPLTTPGPLKITLSN